MPNTIEEQVCDAIDVLINKRVANLQFDRTVRGTIKSVEDASIGKYLVQYQDSVFYAYSDPDETYKKGAQIYVQIPSNDFNKTKRIIGAVKKLGTEYLTAVSAQDKMTKIGSNILENKKRVQFCSYTEGSQQIALIKNNGVATSYLSVDPDDLNTYKIGAGYFLIGMTIQTNLSIEQQTGSGNYGIIVQVEYYTTAQRESLGDSRTPITRTYVLDVNNMLGQPYKYTLSSQQYAIFAIDGNNLKGIKTIKAFCKGFPKQEPGHNKDISLSDFKINFMQPLTEEELSTSSLKILTPYGAYLTSEDDDTKYLEAELKLKGKKVNFKEQKVDFYWFVKDTSILASNKLYYSSLAGQGWRCLNRSQTFDNKLTQFIAQGYRKHITISMVPAKQTTFKCVAVYNDTTLSDTIKIGNKVSATQVSISSSAGTKFYFDTGKTILTCTPYNKKYTYAWGHRSKDGVLIRDSVPQKNPTKPDEDLPLNMLNAQIQEATEIITYECTVFNGNNRVGSAQITLTNGTPQNEYVLVINNGTRVFKYDEYGVSPASKSVAFADRITIPTLTFDIYDDLGRIVTPLQDSAKTKQCEIQWIVPDKEYSMIQWSNTIEEKIIQRTITNPTNNNEIIRRVFPNSATFTYSIKNKFDINATDNNIRLEVVFQGHNLVATTNFTFVKEGQLGTNGTKYISRIVPNNNNYTEYYLQKGELWGWYKRLSTRYNSSTGKTTTEENYVFSPQPIKGNPFRAEIWDGSPGYLYRATSGKNLWKVLDPVDFDTKDKKYVKRKPGIEINTTNCQITSFNNAEVSTIIQSKITSDLYSQLAKYYYATYPLTIVTNLPENRHAIIDGGFRECMYNNDGTRSSFNSKPFIFKIFNKETGEIINISKENKKKIKWVVSWDSSQDVSESETGDTVTIEPPEVFNSQITNNYIVCTYGSYKIIISVNFYLNRYGMAAMNDWDGTSIQINKDGDQYILAPQIGAGKKDGDNRFTGITMGKTFGVNGTTAKAQIGLMGFREGIRSIFLDADSGRAIFGEPSSSQIVMSPSKYGDAPRGSIYSANYWKWDRTDGAPRSKTTDEVTADEGNGIGNGLLIDLVTPRIRFGSGNFVVSKQGHLTAQGGGKIAGWKIGNKSLKSTNNEVAMYSSGKSGSDDGAPSVTVTDIFINQQGKETRTSRTVQERFHVGSNSNSNFIIYDDGTFKATRNGNFKVDADGTLTANAGSIGGWSITSNFLRSPKGDTTLYSKDSTLAYDSEAGTYQRFNINNGKFVIYKDGTFKANNGKFSVTKGGVLTSTEGHIGGWTINSSDGLKSEDGKTYLNSKSSTRFNINDNFMIYSDGTFRAANDKFVINRNGSLSVNNTFEIYSDGSFRASNGAFSVDRNGYLESTSGKIGSWIIGTDELSGGGIHMYSNSGQIKGNNWQINGNGYARFTHVDITGDNTSTLSWGADKFNVYSDGSMKATSGFIGDWVLGSGFTNSAGTVSFTPAGGLTLGSGFSVTSGGSLNATAGYVGGCKINGGTLEANNLRLAGNTAGWDPMYVVTGIQGWKGYTSDVLITFNVPTYQLIKDVGSGDYSLRRGSEEITARSPGKFLTGFQVTVSGANRQFLGGQTSYISDPVSVGITG